MQGSELKAQIIAVENREHHHLCQKTSETAQDQCQSKNAEAPLIGRLFLPTQWAFVPISEKTELSTLHTKIQVYDMHRVPLLLAPPHYSHFSTDLLQGFSFLDPEFDKKSLSDSHCNPARLLLIPSSLFILFFP